MNGQTKRYKDSLATTSEPILLSQMSQSLDLRGIMHYAKNKGIKVAELSEQEKMMFVSTRKV
jgi:hypothetical protein